MSTFDFLHDIWYVSSYIYITRFLLPTKRRFLVPPLLPLGGYSHATMTPQSSRTRSLVSWKCIKFFAAPDWVVAFPALFSVAYFAPRHVIKTLDDTIPPRSTLRGQISDKNFINLSYTLPPRFPFAPIQLVMESEPRTCNFYKETAFCERLEQGLDYEPENHVISSFCN